MDRIGRRSLSLLIVLVMASALLIACGAQEETEALPENTVGSDVVVLEADGRCITVEDAGGSTLAQLLKEAQITLNDGDVMTVVPGQQIAGKLDVAVLRRCTVQIVVSGGEDAEDDRYTVVLYGGTVEDAVNAAGIRMNRAQTMDAEPDEAIRDGMVIHIVSNGEAPADSTPPPTPTPAPTSAPASTGEITVVSMEKYEDCDGSGHGVIVYTYSDGSQEEVEY